MSTPRRIEIYDTTLRDGTQGEGFNLSLQDKLSIAKKLDELGVDYIEGGFPLSNPKDEAFFKDVRELKLKRAKVAAFGMTRRRGTKAKDDPGMRALLEAQTPVVTIVGKSSEHQATRVLGVSLEENLEMIADSVRLMKEAGRQVVYDAEHFFDAYRANREFALKTLAAAEKAGASVLCLCDTNGGSMPELIAEAVEAAKKNSSAAIGIHTHNDSGVAVANALAAIRVGASHVQGTVNGVGERCGNMDLIPLIANLQLKYNLECLRPGTLQHLTEVSRYVYETANMNLVSGQPYVGASAFAHKGGMHVHAVQKDTSTYEHVSPESIGNTRKILISELSGVSNIATKAGKKFDLENDKATLRRVLEKIQELENAGYQFEAAEASFELLVRREVGRYRKFFDLEHYRVQVLRMESSSPVAEATVKLKIGELVEHRVAEADGPVAALDGALRKALTAHYPQISGVHLFDYKVRVINSKDEASAAVRVVIECRRDVGDGSKEIFGTIGVSENIIDASWQALVDAYEYHLIHVAESKQQSRAKMELLNDIPSERFPRHIAIIMDGNGRWAVRQGLERIRGHEAGAKTVRAVVTECAQLRKHRGGPDFLTLYSFSLENWKRPTSEVTFLMQMYIDYLRAERPTMMENNIRFRQIGRLDNLPDPVLDEVNVTLEQTKNNSGLTLVLALNYGSRAEIVDAVQAIADKVKSGQLDPRRIDEETISSHLYTAGMPDPDLLVRTAGEMRISNYLLWQISYAELYVSDVLWPDFGADELHAAIRAFASRNRRFGALDHTNTLSRAHPPMEQSLKNRLTYGPLMLAVLFALLLFDHYAQNWTAAQGWNRVSTDGHAAGIGGVGLLIILLLVLPPATVELATLFAAERVRPYRFISAVGSGMLILHAFATQFRKFQLYSTSALAYIIAFTMLFAALRRAWMRQTQEAITHMAGTVLGTLYLGGLGWFLMALRVKHSVRPDRFSGTTMIILMILLVVKSTDIGAFFGGRALGRRKLIPWLSPGKTWEGLFCGLLTAGAVGALCSPWINPPDYHLEWWKGAIFGVVIGGIGQVGDLLESLMKRDAEVKDSGSLIPGFGGMLDVIDSPLLAAPFAYLLFSLF